MLLRRTSSLWQRRHLSADGTDTTWSVSSERLTAERGTTARGLRALVRGPIGEIVHEAIRTDPSQRLESAERLAARVRETLRSDALRRTLRAHRPIPAGTRRTVALLIGVTTVLFSAFATLLLLVVSEPQSGGREPDFTQEIQAITALVSLDPDSVEARDLLGKMAFEMTGSDAPASDQAVARAVLLALQESSAGSYVEKAALSLGPRNENDPGERAEARIAIAYELLRRGHLESAIEILQQLLSDTEGSPGETTGVRCLAAFTLVRAGGADALLKYLRTATSAGSFEPPEVHLTLLALASRASGDEISAEALLTRIERELKTSERMQAAVEIMITVDNWLPGDLAGASVPDMGWDALKGR